MIGGSWDNSGLQGVAGGLEDKLSISFSNVFSKNTQNKVEKGEEGDLTTVEFGGKTHVINTYVQIYKQIKNGATVINYSLGPKQPSSKHSFSTQLDKKFLQKVSKKYPKVLFVAAAGNEAGQLDGSNYGFGGLSQPNIITVGALNNKGANASFTNTAVGNGEVTLAASGVGIPVAYDSKGNVIKWDGTSFATPQVSGAVAVLKSINPELTAVEIKNILENTADTSIDNAAISDKEVKINQSVGGKVLRLDNAVLEVLKKLPISKRPDNLDKDHLLGLFDIEVEATIKKDDPLGWDVSAQIDTLSQKGTQVTIDFQGEGQIVGKTSESLEEAGNLTWIFGFFEQGEEATILITREDTQACSRLYLESSPLFGGNTTIPVPDFPSNAMTFTNTKVQIDNKGNLEYLASGDDNIEIIAEAGYKHQLEYTMTLEASGPLDKNQESFKHQNIQGEWKFDFTIYFDPELVSLLGSETYTDSVGGLLTLEGIVGEDGIKGDLKLYDSQNNSSLFDEGTFNVSQ